MAISLKNDWAWRQWQSRFPKKDISTSELSWIVNRGRQRHWLISLRTYRLIVQDGIGQLHLGSDFIQPSLDIHLLILLINERWGRPTLNKDYKDLELSFHSHNFLTYSSTKRKSCPFRGMKAWRQPSESVFCADCLFQRLLNAVLIVAGREGLKNPDGL